MRFNCRGLICRELICRWALLSMGSYVGGSTVGAQLSVYLVGFTLEEYKKAIDASSPNNINSARGGSGWLGGNPSAGGGAANLVRTRTQSETPIYKPNKVINKKKNLFFKKFHFSLFSPLLNY